MRKLQKAVEIRVTASYGPTRSMTRWRSHRRHGQEVEGVEALDCGEARRLDPALHHAVMAVYQLELSQPQQVAGMVDVLGGAKPVTTNLPFDEWTEVFGSERLTGALLDRLTHRVHILEMNGESYRLRQSRTGAALRSAGDPSDA